MELINLTTKHDHTIRLGKFTLLVGPNNVGKSQALKDIHRKLVKGHKADTVLISSIEVNRPSSFEKLYEGLDVRVDYQNIGHHIIDGVTSGTEPNSMIRVQLEPQKKQFEAKTEYDHTFLGLSKFRVFYMDSESRLKIASKSPNYIPDEFSPKNLMQALYGACGNFDQKLQEAFQSTFDMDIRLDYSSGLEIRLAVSKIFEEIPEDIRKAYPLMKKYPSIEIQGDGFRSFVAVVMTLLLSKDKVVLLDEPEAFLHPEQARRLGKWISDHTESFPCQILIATHNSNFLSGLLSGKQSANIYRLNRVDDVTSFTKITSDATRNLSNSPILSSQRVLEAIFARGVVVCESDTDRIIYNTVAIREYNNQEILFIHAHNKQTIKDVVELLRKASIPVAGIVDIDILNSSSDLSSALYAFNSEAEITDIISIQKEIVSIVERASEEVILQGIKEKTSEFLDQLNSDEHSLSGAKSALMRIKKESSKWSDLKKNGVASLEESFRSKAQEVINYSKTLGLFIVPVGELESWINLDVRKNRWIVPALEYLHRGDCPEALKEFVNDILVHINNQANR